jgi:hypothetical protein
VERLVFQRADGAGRLKKRKKDNGVLYLKIQVPFQTACQATRRLAAIPSKTA